MNTPKANNPPIESTLPERIEQSMSSPSSIWALHRILTLGLALALIVGGAYFTGYTPRGQISSHLIDRHIAIGSAIMNGGFMLFAVYMLTGILASQPSTRSSNDRNAEPCAAANSSGCR